MTPTTDTNPTTRWSRMDRCPTCDGLCCENRLTDARSPHKRRCPATHHTCSCAYGYVEVPLATTTTRVPLPFRCQFSGGFMGVSLVDDGRTAIVTAPELSVVTLTQTFGASPSPFSPDPYLVLRVVYGKDSVSLFWNGDGTFDGWDCGTAHRATNLTVEE